MSTSSTQLSKKRDVLAQNSPELYTIVYSGQGRGGIRKEGEGGKGRKEGWKEKRR